MRARVKDNKKLKTLKLYFTLAGFVLSIKEK